MPLLRSSKKNRFFHPYNNPHRRLRFVRRSVCSTKKQSPKGGCFVYCYLFLSYQQRGTGKSEPRSFFASHEGPVCCVDELNFFVALGSQLLHKGVHVAVASRAHNIVDREGPALFQHAKRLQKQLLLVMAGDVVIDVVAGNGVERFVRFAAAPAAPEMAAELRRSARAGPFHRIKKIRTLRSRSHRVRFSYHS